MERQITQPAPRQALRSVPYKLLNVLFSVLFLTIAVVVVLYGSHTMAAFPWYVLLAAVAGGLAVMAVLYRVYAVLPPLSPVAEKVLVAVLLLLLVALQAAVGWQLWPSVPQAGQPGLLYRYAEEYVQTGVLPGEFFSVYPTKAGAYALLCGVLALGKILGVAPLAIPAMVLNAVAIDAAVFLLYFCARRLFGANKAVFVLFLSVLTLPFALCIPLSSAGVLALPFPVAIALLWMRVRASWRAANSRKALLSFFALSLVAGAGALVKPLVLAVWLAAALDILFLLRGRGKLPILLAGLVTAAAVAGGGFFAVFRLPVLPAAGGFPPGAWVMMGLSEGGVHSEEDVALVFSKEEGAVRTAFVRQEITRRLNAMGPLGFLEHQAARLANTYGDGLYAVPARLAGGDAGQSPAGLWAYVLPGGAYFAPVALFAFAVQGGVLLLAVWGGFVALYRRNNALAFVRLALVGVLAFFLLVVCNSTDFLCFLPLFMLCALETAPASPSFSEKGKWRRQMQRELQRQPAEAPLPPQELLPPAGPLAGEPPYTEQEGGKENPPPAHQAAEAPFSRPEFAWEEGGAQEDIGTAVWQDDPPEAAPFGVAGEDLLTGDWPPEEEPGGPHPPHQPLGVWPAELNQNLLEQRQDWVLDFEEEPPAPIALGVRPPDGEPPAPGVVPAAQSALPPDEEPPPPGLFLHRGAAEGYPPARERDTPPSNGQPPQQAADVAWQVMRSIERQLATAVPANTVQGTAAAGASPAEDIWADPLRPPHAPPGYEPGVPTVQKDLPGIPLLYEEEQETGGVNVWMAEQGVVWTPPQGVKMWPSVPGKWEPPEQKPAGPAPQDAGLALPPGGGGGLSL